MNPLITIIIPVYNVSKYLKQCLDSIVNQTYKNLEIIIINDGSTDNSLQICEEYKKNDKRIVLINQLNAGISNARNVAIKKATGSYIMFVDSDDWLELNTCEIALTEMISQKLDLVLFSYFKEYSQKTEFKFILPNEAKFEGNEVTKLRRRLVGLFECELNKPEHADSLVTVWGKLYKTEIIRDNLLFFEDCKIVGTAEDMLFNVRYFKFVDKAYYYHKCLYHYRKYNASSFTTIYKTELQFQWKSLFNKLEQFIGDDITDSEFQQAFNNRVSLSIIGLGLNELSANHSSIQKIKKIDDILSEKRYKLAIKSLKLDYFPIHWKLFFFFVKINFILAVYIMLLGIKKMINKS